jgi:peptidoglycan hydrolase-like protein with peptidoglycan-binding domain
MKKYFLFGLIGVLVLIGLTMANGVNASIDTVGTATITSAITAEIGVDHTASIYLLTETDYTPETWSVYKEAITFAINVEAETEAFVGQTAADATTQAENEAVMQAKINDAISAINTAKSALLLKVQTPNPVVVIPPEVSHGGGGYRIIKPIITATPAGGQVLGATTFKFSKSLRKGMTANDIKELQERLRTEGFFTITPSIRYFGVGTFKSVKAYQKNHNLPSTGFVGPLTIAELNK